VIRYIVVGTDARVRHSVDIECQGGTMLHDMGLSERYAVIMDLPCIFDLDRALAGSTFPYGWSDDYQARLGLLPRDGKADDITWFDIEPCYVFHPLNTFDRPDGSVVMDVARHPRMFDRVKNGPDEGLPALTRFVMDPASGRVTEERLDDRPTEFPRINETLLGRSARYGYAVEFGHGVQHGNTVKYDLAQGRSEVLSHGPGRRSLEAVFIPRDAGGAEDDGWLMQVVYDEGRDGSDLVITHAQDLAAGPVATVTLPQRVPYGFHGNWVPTGQ
jgi:carotenoid cleavage dioxygenase